ncbi:hypothetical protein DAI22_08g079100 [Oryza sativa Japonica Group]|nr:hypothetical protein DAI22_08g079100 [Oryza sativa Japonica Group]
MGVDGSSSSSPSRLLARSRPLSTLRDAAASPRPAASSQLVMLPENLDPAVSGDGDGDGRAAGNFTSTASSTAPSTWSGEQSAINHECQRRPEAAPRDRSFTRQPWMLGSCDSFSAPT